MAPLSVRIDRPVELLVQRFDLCIYSVNEFIDAGLQCYRHNLSAVLLHRSHLNELPPSHHQVLDMQGVRVARWSHRWLEISAEAGNQLRINGIGFGQLTDGCGIAPHPQW